jgi:hypothetical protein
MEVGAITVRTVGTFLLASWPRRLVVGLIMLVPILVAAFGGFEPAEPETFEVPAGDAVDLGPATYQPTGFFVSAETARSDLEYIDGAVAWVGVVVDVENVTDEPLSITFPGPASDSAVPVLEPDVRVESSRSTPHLAPRLLDGSATYALPGVPTQVAYLWPVSSTDSIGDTMTISMTEQVWTYGPLTGRDTWLALGDIWTMDLPRVELPAGLYEPPEDEL